MKHSRFPLAGSIALLLLPCCAGKQDSHADDPAADRRVMVELQLASRDIRDDRVLDAMRSVPRHEFVPQRLRELAYADQPLPIGHGQTISQPYIVAFMTQALAPEPGDRVLEIGTGSGYQAAVLAKLVKHVYSIEIVKPLAKSAAATLTRLEFSNVTTKAGDGHQGWPQHAPFDAIIVTCAPEKIPAPLVKQLKDGGKMMIPVGQQHGAQELILLEKTGNKVSKKFVLPVRFVPMTGQGARTSVRGSEAD